MAELKGEKLAEYRERFSVSEGLQRVNRDMNGQGMLGGIIGMDFGPTWRPFAATDVIWNTRVWTGDYSSFAPIDWDFDSETSGDQMLEAKTRSQNAGANGNVIFSAQYNIPLWDVDSSLLTGHNCHARSGSNLYFEYDADHNDCSDVTVPWEPGMWFETTTDSHIAIIDRILDMAWELSKAKYPCDVTGQAHCGSGDIRVGTFNKWDLTTFGYHQTQPWSVPAPYGATSRGGRGSGVPCFAGVLRPQEVQYGQVNHALCFTYSGLRGDGDRKIYLHPPCVRSDTDSVDDCRNQTASKYLYYGTRIQLDPSKTTADFVAAGITNTNVHTVLRCLQEYGAYCVDYGGGGIKFQRQMLSDQGQTADANAWNALLGGGTHAFLTDFAKTPTLWFRVLTSNIQTLREIDP